MSHNSQNPHTKTARNFSSVFKNISKMVAIFGVVSLGANFLNPLEAFACTPEVQKARLEELDSQIAVYTDLINSPTPKEQEITRKAEITKKKLAPISNSNLIIKNTLSKFKSQIEAKINQEIGSMHTIAVDFGSLKLVNNQIIGDLAVDIQYNYGKDLDGDEQYGFETRNYKLQLDILKRYFSVEYVDPILESYKLMTQKELNDLKSPELTSFQKQNLQNRSTLKLTRINEKQIQQELKELKKDRKSENKIALEKLKQEKLKKCSISVKAWDAYRRFDAAWYSRTYAMQAMRAKYYPEYGNNCANFASQSVVHGGLRHDGGNMDDDYAWWVRRANVNEKEFYTYGYTSTNTWRIADWLKSHVLKNENTSHFIEVGNKEQLKNYRTGDLVFMDNFNTNYNPRGTMDHVMMITGWRNGYPLVSGKTGNELNSDLAEKMARYTLYPVRIN